MAIDPKKSSPNRLYESFKTLINWWNKLPLKSKSLFLIIPCLVVIAVAGLPGFLGPDKNTQITQMSAALSSAQPIVNDLYALLNAYDTGAADSNTVINRLEADKKIVDSSISIIQSANPPNELKNSHNLVLSALQDLSTALGLGIDGVKTNNFPEIYRAMGYKDDLTKKFSDAAAEVSKLGYPSS